MEFLWEYNTMRSRHATHCRKVNNLNEPISIEGSNFKLIPVETRDRTRLLYSIQEK